jgi:hypothetical protein
MTHPSLRIGIQESGVMHRVWNEFNVDTRFHMVKEAGVFDYYDKTPSPVEIAVYQRAAEKHDLPLTAGGWFYQLGRDEPLLEWHLRLAADLGTEIHNVQIFTHDHNGEVVSNERVRDVYLWAAELGDKLGVTPCFEVHVNMWSEHVGRVERVARMVEDRGVPFHMTLDHSHVIFKIDNPEEQQIQNMRADVESGALVLDPFAPGNVTDRWIDANWVTHTHARPAVPNGPVNVWAVVDGKPGRGIQYPFLPTTAEEFHQPWDGAKLEPWKQVLRRLLTHHARDPDSSLKTITTELIPWPDYGGGAKYSLFDHSVAVAQWIRETWAKAQATW